MRDGNRKWGRGAHLMCAFCRGLLSSSASSVDICWSVTRRRTMACCSRRSITRESVASRNIPRWVLSWWIELNSYTYLYMYGTYCCETESDQCSCRSVRSGLNFLYKEVQLLQMLGVKLNVKIYSRYKIKYTYICTCTRVFVSGRFPWTFPVVTRNLTSFESLLTRSRLLARVEFQTCQKLKRVATSQETQYN